MFQAKAKALQKPAGSWSALNVGQSYAYGAETVVRVIVAV